MLEAKYLAEAALHYAKVTKAANETQADCLRIIVRAEMRMADEIDKGQAAGQISTGGRPKEETVLTLDSLGVDRRRVAEWMIRYRALLIAAGYPDGNDCDALKSDPAFKMAVGRLPENGEDLRSQPTISRLEACPGRPRFNA